MSRIDLFSFLVLAWFCYQSNSSFIKDSLLSWTYLLVYSLKGFVKDWYCLFLPYMKPAKPSGPIVFFKGNIFDYQFSFFNGYKIIQLYVSIWVSYCLLGICPHFKFYLLSLIISSLCFECLLHLLDVPFLLFFNYSWHSIVYISFRCTEYWLDI